MNAKQTIQMSCGDVGLMIGSEQDFRDRIICGDCVAGMRALPDNSFDLAIADPPYNLSSGGTWKWDNSVRLEGMGGNWEKVMQGWDNMSLSEYFQFTLAWLAELKRIVRPTGSLWVHGTYHNSGVINLCMQILGVEIINEVVWYKKNSFPNLSGRRLTASHETMLWAHAGGEKRRYFFNYEASKNIPYPEDLLKSPGKQMRTVWDIPNNKKPHELSLGKHPTQKPERLIQRLFDISMCRGGSVVVPFVGSGTDCVIAKRNGCSYTGFELEREYVELAERRIAAEHAPGEELVLS